MTAMKMWEEERKKDGGGRPILLEGVTGSGKTEIYLRALEADIKVEALFHLVCHDRAKLEERLKRRALRDNRLDDASDKVIHDRLETYLKETKPVLDYYGDKLVKEIDAEQFPYEVTRDILSQVHTTKAERKNRKLAEVVA